MTGNLLNAVADVINEGQKSEKRGLYYFAGLKYSQASGMLKVILMLRDSREFALNPKEEGRLAILFDLLATCLQRL